MKAVRKVLLCAGIFLLVSFSLQVSAQKYGITTDNYLGVMVGMNYSTLRFKSPTENKEFPEIGFKTGLNLGFSYIRWVSERQNLGIELNYTQNGATGETEFSSIRWNFEMVGSSVYYGYKIVNKNTYALEPGLFTGVDLLLSADQTINGREFSIANGDILNSWLLRGGITIKNYMYFQDYVDLMVEYRFNYGFSNLEKLDSAIGQNSTLQSHLLNLGIRIHL